MPRDDYEAISKIIEEVVGKDTLNGIKLLEGIKFYFDNKVERIRVVNNESSINYRPRRSMFSDDADKAMKKYTERLSKENAKFRKSKTKEEACAITG